MIDSGRRPIIIFESTVYPGVTEDICAPELESASGLVCGRDFFLGYSPERINPGDREHTIDKITKVVSGQTPDVLEKIAALYAAITTGGVFRAASIRAAEAAKVMGVVITLLPDLAPSAMAAKCKAAVPLATATAYFAPMYCAKWCSNWATAGPCVR